MARDVGDGVYYRRCFMRNLSEIYKKVTRGTGTVVELVSLVAQVCEFLFFFQLYCILIKTKKPESSFLELSDFFTGDTYRASTDHDPDQENGRGID